MLCQNEQKLYEIKWIEHVDEEKEEEKKINDL